MTDNSSGTTKKHNYFLALRYTAGLLLCVTHLRTTFSGILSYFLLQSIVSQWNNLSYEDLGYVYGDRKS
ncbi:uncharacterized protein H6S33_011636 [Morchella sextelata]|uniref:uncharacterized protein n=1 Tax=Morchella sextelata TaxID=1174677 RepID=UPI001D044A26|nr:uncharacterized protein H6S33_011636 [Morchella sextelata]KAH0611209.1 hypothetical protein H6S33_011636 [Morchella sextelata]